jgi:hypothetical protein
LLCIITRPKANRRHFERSAGLDICTLLSLPRCLKSAAPAVDIARARTYLPLIPINRSPGGA